MNKGKRLSETISDIKTNTVHLKYTTLTIYARAKARSEPAVVARLGLPDFAELMDFLILHVKRLF